MNLDLAVQPLQHKDRKYNHDAYQVVIGPYKVLAISTGDENTLKKWLKEVLKTKTCPPTGKKGAGSLVVGLAVQRKNRVFNDDGQELDTPYDLVQLCTQRQCLLYHLSTPKLPKLVREFFMKSRLTFVGMHINEVEEKLGRYYGLEIANGKDLNELCENKIKKPEMNLMELDLYGLSWKVVEKQVQAVRPDLDLMGDMERCKWATADAFLSFMLGFRVLTKRVEVEGREVKLNKKAWKSYWTNRVMGGDDSNSESGE